LLVLWILVELMTIAVYASFFFIEVSVPGKLSERSCICVLGVSDLALSTTVKPVYKGH